MVNAVMDAIALLSSLATDLDIMLNDLRSSPGSRLLPSATHLHQRNPPNTSATSSPLTIESSTGGAHISTSGHTSTGYLQSALRSSQHNQQHLGQHYHHQQQQQQQQHSVQLISTQTTTATPLQQQQHYNHDHQQQHHRSASATRNQNPTPSTLTTQGSNQSQQQQYPQQQQRLNQDSYKLRARHANIARNGSEIIASGNAAAAAKTHQHEPAESTASRSLVGLSPDVRQIQKLPLWSYQQKQLQQPQKLHVQLLQQQQATKAIASQITDATDVVSRTSSTTTTTSLGVAGEAAPAAAVVGGNRSSSSRSSSSICGYDGKITTSTTTTSIMTNSSSATSSTDFSYGRSGHCSRANSSSWLQSSTRFFGLPPDKDTIWSSSEHHHGAQTTTAQQQQQQQQTSGQNQLKTTAAAVSTAAATTTASNNSSNSNNNNNNNNRRLPYCGLDSIKGSDNNGEGGGLSGTTNLSFDLNLPSNAGGGGGVSAAAAADAASEQFHSLDANDGDGQFEDDMQALLPKCNSRLSRDELSQSRTSLVSSSDGGILAEGETSSETSRGTDDCPPCDLGLVERLLLTHPVWFLPGIQRSGAVHFLQGKEEGNFIVRGSSQPNTMAVSVRLPLDTGPYIEHYLIQSNDGILSLESSRFKFDSIPALIAHYAQCCDELPVQLELPRALREAKNRQQLSSLALLGQEFWRYPMSCPKPSETEANLLDAKSPNSLTETSGLGTTVFSNSAGSNSGGGGGGGVGAPQLAANKLFSPTNNLSGGGIFSQAGTPSDTTSSMSSFTTSGGQHMQLMSPESIDSVILTMSPVENFNNQRNGIIGLGSGAELGNATSNLSTFKSAGSVTQLPFKFNKNNPLDNGIRPQRPKPPNTLNLDLRKPPAPPLRWSKPLSPHSPTAEQPSAANNFTVTTTVTFSVDNKNSSPQFVEVTTPAPNSNPLNSAINSNASTFQTFAKRLSPEGECKDTLSSQGSSSNGSRNWQSQSSKDSNNSQRKILSPSSVCSSSTPTSALGGSSKSSRKSKARKESKHYQESDILESPQIYCRSTLTDKISDYEDLWSHEPSDRAGLLTSFRPPDGVQGKRPDLLAETPTITSLSSNLLSPANSSIASSTASPPHPMLTPHDITATPTAAETTSDTQQLIQFVAEVPRSRTDLLLPGLLMSQSLTEDQFRCETTEGDTTPTAQTPVSSQSRSKQGSPFYAEPADALRQAGLTTASILRRSQRGGPLLPANHRHSEPPKGGVVSAGRMPMCPLLLPAEIEKIAGSLDELKKKNQQQLTSASSAQPQQQQQQQPSKRARGRFEQWQLDSSWEFMGKHGAEDDDDDNECGPVTRRGGDYSAESHWKQQPQSAQTSQEQKENSLGREANKENKQRPITVHQIIAKRLPDLNLPELVRCSTPQQQQQQPPQQQNGVVKQLNELNGSQKSFDSQNGCRLSSYDNVERNYSFCQSFFVDSAQSDDGTVFSEPWDSSQWDSFMPQDDATITSDTIHLSKCRPAVSEDDTITEELNTKENNQDTLKAKRSHGRQKVATILRNPSMRDREILCHPRNKINPYGGGPGDSVRAYTLQLAQDQCSTFSRNIENFISCTKESREAAPQVVMRNMRQFMNGMKNYLVKHGEGKFHQEVESARSRLKSDEFLNLDAILETVMHQLVVLPLREHLYGMFVDYYTRSEDIQLLAQNVKYACGRSAADFGIRAAVTPPSTNSLHDISNLLLRLQEAELPLDKLDLFLCVISTIFDATGCPRGQQLGADDFLPILVYVVAKCGFVGAEIEAEFMWGLLQPTLLNGEPGYYLTALCSAVHVLKSFMASENESGTGSLDWRSSSLPACSSVLRVIIPDECNGSLQTRTLPVRPHTTTREVCRIIAHKARITNPQDYALFTLVDGEETLLSDIECPQDIRLSAKGKHCMLAYKRIDAKIAWPTATQPVYN